MLAAAFSCWPAPATTAVTRCTRVPSWPPAGSDVTIIATGSRVHEPALAAALAAGADRSNVKDAARLAAEADVVVDGILGTGTSANPALRGGARDVVQAILPVLKCAAASARRRGRYPERHQSERRIGARFESLRDRARNACCPPTSPSPSAGTRPDCSFAPASAAGRPGGADRHRTRAGTARSWSRSSALRAASPGPHRSRAGQTGTNKPSSN